MPPFSQNKKTRGFTLIEIVVSMIIVSVLAGVAMVNYQKNLIIEHERDAAIQLKLIYHASKTYKDKTGAYLAGSGLDLAHINSGLGLNIFSNNLTYSYDADVTWGFLAEASYNTRFTLRLYGDLELSSLAGDSKSQLAGKTGFDLWPAAFSNFFVSSAHAGNPNANPCCSAGTCYTIPACF